MKDIPAFKWLNVYEENSLSNLSRTGKICRRAMSVYMKISGELIDRFGVSENYMRILHNRIRIEILWNEILRTGDRSKIAFIEALEVDNGELTSKFKKIDLFESVVKFEQQGIKRNTNEITAFELYAIQEALEKQYKEQLKAQSNVREKSRK